MECVEWGHEDSNKPGKSLHPCLGGEFIYGRPTAADIDLAFTYMGAWLPLAAETVNAEFPQWELLQAFNLFASVSPDDGMPEIHTDYLRRFAHAFTVPLESLTLQHQMLLKYVRREYAEGSTAGDVNASWVVAVNRLRESQATTRNSKRLFPLGHYFLLLLPPSPNNNRQSNEPAY